jgi:hypothetical protein
LAKAGAWQKHLEETVKRVPSLLVLAMLLVPTVVTAGKIQNDFDTGVDFTNYTTYTWREGLQASQPSVQTQIVQAVDAELSSKYLRRIQANPDVFVVLHASAQEMSINMNDHGYSYGSRWQWGGGMKSDSAVQTYPKGTLVVDIWESKTQKLIWRGVATDVLDKGSGKITQGIQKMFLKYPPPIR